MRNANDIAQMVPAEKAILDATYAVEALPADVRLTNVVLLLIQAKSELSAWVDDGVKCCDYDTDGDGNCPFHIRRGERRPNLEF